LAPGTGIGVGSGVDESSLEHEIVKMAMIKSENVFFNVFIIFSF